MQSLYEKAESSMMHRVLVHLLLMIGSVGAMITCGAAIPISVRQARPMLKSQGLAEWLMQPIGDDDYPHSPDRMGFLEEDVLLDTDDDFHRRVFGMPYFDGDDFSMLSTQTDDDTFLFGDDSMHWSSSGDWV